LSAARRITLPLFSGLGAIGGLLFVAYLPSASPVFAPERAPLAITTTSPLHEGTLNQAYTTTLKATGGMPPYDWKFAAGPTPSGLQLSPQGVLSGEPNTVGQTSFGVQVTDRTGSIASGTFTLLVEDPTQESKPQAPTQGKSTAEGSAPKTPPDEGDANAKPTINEKVLQPPPSLGDIFDLRENLIGLLVAAVFGLAPGALFNRLQQQADRYNADLKSSQPTEETRKS